MLPPIVVVSSADLEVVDDSGSEIPGSLVVDDDSDTSMFESVVEVDPSGPIGPVSVVLGEESKLEFVRLTFDVRLRIKYYENLSYFILRSKLNCDGNCYQFFIV